MNTSKIMWAVVAVVGVGMVGFFSYLLGTQNYIENKNAAPNAQNNTISQVDTSLDGIPITYTSNTNNLESQKINIVVYIQDKSKVFSETCSAVKPASIVMPKTNSVLDVSLRYLFTEELARYGTYESVKVANGIAKVFIYEKMNSYSSCESAHLRSVIENTLTQYPTIQKVELYRAGDRSRIEF